MGKGKWISYVTFATSIVSIKLCNDSDADKITELGAHRVDDKTIQIEYNGHDELAIVFSKLLDLGIAFSAGKDWAPSEIFEYLRGKGLISGKYKKISWSGPGLYSVNEY